MSTIANPPEGIGAQVRSDSDEAQIRAARASSNRAIAAHDVAGAIAVLDGSFHAAISSGEFRTSREEMGRAFAERFDAFADAVYVRTPATVEVATNGAIASETGEWVGSWTTSEGPFRTGGRYAAHWRKDADGRWLIRSELFVPLFCEGPGCS
jgi:ketosteroid isomerase-like protein